MKYLLRTIVLMGFIFIINGCNSGKQDYSCQGFEVLNKWDIEAEEAIKAGHKSNAQSYYKKISGFIEHWPTSGAELKCNDSTYEFNQNGKNKAMDELAKLEAKIDAM